MNDFLCCIQVAYDCLLDNKPATITTVRNTIAAGATVAQVKAEGINDMALFFKHQLFCVTGFWRPAKPTYKRA